MDSLFSALLGIAISISMILFVISIIRVWFLEFKINRLYKKRDEDTARERKRFASRGTIQLGVDKIRETTQTEIDVLERKRRFILDKLPFLKKS